MPQNLGQRMRQIETKTQEAAQRKTLAEEAERNEETLIAMLQVQHFFEYAFRVFEHRLLNGKPPGHISLGGRTFRDVATMLSTFRWDIPYGTSVDWRTQGRGIWTPSNKYHSLWLDFEARCAEVGLTPVWSPAHDGVGVESWFDLTVVPA